MILVKEWQDKASNKNKKEHNKRYKWCVRGSPVGCTLKRSTVKIIIVKYDWFIEEWMCLDGSPVVFLSFISLIF